jgi:hypothetical protein
VPTVDIDREAAHDAAQRELGKAIYPKATLSQQFSDWLDNLLYRLMLEGSSVPGGWFTISILVILLVVALVFAVRLARRTMGTNRSGDYRLFGPAELSSAEHRATAEQFAARGDWAGAIRHRLRAIARHLEETGVLNPVPGRTANELARDAGASLPALAGELTNAATAFNDVTYGAQPGTAAAYRMVADLDDHLRSRSPATAATPDAPPAGGETWAEVR